MLARPAPADRGLPRSRRTGSSRKNVFIYFRGEYLDVFEVMRGGARGRARGGAARRTSRSSSTAAPAPTSAARSRRCSSRSRASAASRARGRRSPPSPGLYGSPTLINNVRDDRHRARRSSSRAATGTPRSARRDLARHARLLVVGQRRERPATTSSSWGRRCASWSTTSAAGSRTGRELKAIIPGGSSTPVMTPDLIDTPLDYNSVAEVGSQFGCRGAHRDRRPRVHGAAGPALDPVLHARVVRQVHAVPRGDALDGAAPARAGGWSRRPGAARPAGDVADRILGQLPVPAGRLRREPGLEYVRKFRDEFQRHIDEGGCPFGGESSLEGVFAPVDQHSHHPTAEVPS